MPPQTKISKAEILSAAMELVRSSGLDALNARALAKALGCSTQPIFSNYDGMELLRQDLIRAASERYRSYLAEHIVVGDYPAYKASGMAYISFAGEEKELFRLLFMRDRSEEADDPQKEDFSSAVTMLRQATGLDHETASLLHLEMWVCVHGIAAMVATGYLTFEKETVSRMLTDCYLGLKHRLSGKEQDI